ncbi:MAG: hypothetical protein O8C63_01525 [Candidatus Methanoperedens sp.]|nr:hypothetical protein [Candidatus Methanoperedens sp.]
MAPKDSLLLRLATFRRDLSAFNFELVLDPIDTINQINQKN